MNKNHIFDSNLNNKFKSIPLKTRTSDMGEIKYLPPVSKEWKNTVYSYNSNNTKNLPINNINANKIIQSYFKLYFKDNKFVDSRYIGTKKRRTLLKKIYTSNIETKHTNSKIIATLYTINPNKSILEKNYKNYLVHINKKILAFWKLKLKNKIISYIRNNKQKSLPLYNITEKKLFVLKYKLLNESLNWYNLYLKLYLTRAIKFSYYDKLRQLRKFQFNYYLNKFKFEKEIFLSKLSNLLQKVYNNNIEFNIINLKSFTYNTDILTEALALRLKRRNRNVNSSINSILKLVDLPKVNRIMEKSNIIKNKNPLLLENKYKNLSLLYMIKQNSNDTCFLNKLLKEVTNYNSESLYNNSKEGINKDYINISNIIFNSIKYKNMGGIRLEVKGRLTKRYRADRSLYKVKWKGGLKNMDSSYKKLSTVMYRGYSKSNISYSLNESKRRIGAFAVKGWVSGK